VHESVEPECYKFTMRSCAPSVLTLFQTVAMAMFKTFVNIVFFPLFSFRFNKFKKVKWTFRSRLLSML